MFDSECRFLSVNIEKRYSEIHISACHGKGNEKKNNKENLPSDHFRLKIARCNVYCESFLTPNRLTTIIFHANGQSPSLFSAFACGNSRWKMQNKRNYPQYLRCRARRTTKVAYAIISAVITVDCLQLDSWRVQRKTMCLSRRE